MCRPAKLKSNKANSSNLYSPAKGYFREMCISQNIESHFSSPKCNLGIIQITIKSLSTIFSAYDSSIKIYLSVQFFLSDLTTRPRGQGREQGPFLYLCWTILDSLKI